MFIKLHNTSSKPWRKSELTAIHTECMLVNERPKLTNTCQCCINISSIVDFIFTININKYMYVRKWFIYMMTSDAEYTIRLNWWKSQKLFPHVTNGFYGSGHGHILNHYLNYPHFLVLYWEVCHVRPCQTVEDFIKKVRFALTIKITIRGICLKVHVALSLFILKKKTSIKMY